MVRRFFPPWYSKLVDCAGSVSREEANDNLCRHEHLYAGIEDRLIRSDHFGHAFDAKNHIGHTSVMLCTLSMLSNPGLDSHGFFRHVPLERLIVDEASQIDTFEFKVSAPTLVRDVYQEADNIPILPAPL